MIEKCIVRCPQKETHLEMRYNITINSAMKHVVTIMTYKFKEEFLTSSLVHMSLTRNVHLQKDYLRKLWFRFRFFQGRTIQMF